MKRKTIIEGSIAIALPVIYFFLLGGFEGKAPVTEQKTYDPLSVIKRDFVNKIREKKYIPDTHCSDSRNNSADFGIISRMTSSQRLVFKVSHDTSDNQNNSSYFGHLNGYFEIDSSGAEVVYASSGSYVDGRNPMEECYIARNIRSTVPFNIMLDSANCFEWYIKPSLKIRKGDFSPADTRPVAAIITRNFQGRTVDSTVLRVRNFSDQISKYNGKFTDKFMSEFEMPGDFLRISAKELFTGCGGKGTGFDISIYWYGEVDLWFNKVTLDDGVAKALLEGEYNSKIEASASPEFFDCTIRKIIDGNYTEANILPLNYVLNVMQEKLNVKNP